MIWNNEEWGVEICREDALQFWEECTGEERVRMREDYAALVSYDDATRLTTRFVIFDLAIAKMGLKTAQGALATTSAVYALLEEGVIT